MLIKGEDLNEKQRRQVLAAYVHRQHDTTCQIDHEWTEKSDEIWLAKHAFHFIKDGSRLYNRPRYAEPVYMAETPKDDFVKTEGEIAKLAEGLASVVRCMTCKRVIMVVFRDFWIESDDRHTPDEYHSITSDMQAECTTCRPIADEEE